MLGNDRHKGEEEKVNNLLAAALWVEVMKSDLTALSIAYRCMYLAFDVTPFFHMTM